PLAGRTLVARRIETTAPVYFDATILAGAALLGATNVSMILGHWYLIMRRLSFEYLERFAQIFLGAVALRALLILITLGTMRTGDPQLAATFIPPLLSASQD